MDAGSIFCGSWGVIVVLLRLPCQSKDAFSLMSPVGASIGR